MISVAQNVLKEKQTTQEATVKKIIVLCVLALLSLTVPAAAKKETDPDVKREAERVKDIADNLPMSKENRDKIKDSMNRVEKANTRETKDKGDKSDKGGKGGKGDKGDKGDKASPGGKPSK